MRELLLVCVLFVAFLLVRSLYLLPWEGLFYSGIWVVAAGVAFGVPTGFVYHVRLYQALKPLSALPERWYWNPMRLNDRVPEAKRTEVIAWCYAGGVGFVIICVGLLMMGVGVAIAILRGV